MRDEENNLREEKRVKVWPEKQDFIKIVPTPPRLDGIPVNLLQHAVLAQKLQHENSQLVAQYETDIGTFGVEHLPGKEIVCEITENEQCFLSLNKVLSLTLR